MQAYVKISVVAFSPEIIPAVTNHHKTHPHLLAGCRLHGHGRHHHDNFRFVLTLCAWCGGRSYNKL